MYEATAPKSEFMWKCPYCNSIYPMWLEWLCRQCNFSVHDLNNVEESKND